MYYRHGMKLSKYLVKNKLSKAQFADMIGCSRQSIYLWIKGSERPSFRFLEKIYKLTNGLVDMEDF